VKPEANTRGQNPARWFGLAGTGALALFLALYWLGGPTRPNLLLICIDTLRADLFLHQDIDDALSPWLAQAQQYEQAITVAPWTLPTVATVFTGLYPVQHGAGSFSNPIHNMDLDPPTPLSAEADTLAEILADQGWRTGIFTTHPWLKQGFGLDQGFTHVIDNGDGSTLIQRMLEWTGSDNDQWFAYLHLMEAHDLHRKPEDQVRARLAALDEQKQAFIAANPMPGVCRGKPSLRCKRSQAYTASVLEARESLAGILASLDHQGSLENTVVVLYSDHGEAFRERREQHESLQEDPRGMYGTGHGQYQFQEMLHVPLLAWLPGIPGKAISDRVSLVDLFPSLLHWLGVPASQEPELPGTVLDPAIDTNAPDRILYASSIAYGPETIAILSGDRKAMYWPDQDRFIFFDLGVDPDERDPRQDDALLLEFSTLAGDYLALPEYFSAEPPVPGQQQLEELQAIGYLQGVEDDTEDPTEEGGQQPDKQEIP
jgi:arylsulfatase A-like enzyme